MNKFFRRLMLFGLGFAISSVFVYFFMYRNRNLPAFWPSGKVKEKIDQSTRISNADSCYYACLGWTEEELKAAINDGSVHFRKSKPREQPCSQYIIEVEDKSKQAVWLDIQSCDSTFAISEVYANEGLDKKMCGCK